MAEKVKSFIVIKEVTIDKKYNVGAKIELTDKKVIEKLISNKIIK